MTKIKPLYRRAGWLGVIPFVLMIAGYWYLAEERHLANPQDPLLPLPIALYQALHWALQPGPDGWSPLFGDTLASLARLFGGLISAGILALSLAMLMRIAPPIRQTLHPFIITLAKVPPLALLPILLLWMGPHETAKQALLLFGITPVLIIQLDQTLQQNARRFADKLASLALPWWQRLTLVEIPLVWASFMHQLQSLLGTAWLYILAAETFGAEYGLGYRIFVVRRYLAMDVILVYVIWITLLSLLIYSLLGLAKRRWGAHAH